MDFLIKLGFKPSLFVLAGFTAPLIAFVEKYIWSDWQFATLLFIVVICDTSTGLYAAWKSKTINSKAFERVFVKIALYCFALVSVHAVAQYIKLSGGNIPYLADVIGYFDSAIYAGILFRELLSINENLAKVDVVLLPKWLTKRLQAFDDDGEPNKEA
jgi:toxin secretion/phage lysis holin